MRLIDDVKNTDRRLVIPLAGYPGVQLTRSTVKQVNFNAELQARSLYKLAEATQPDAMFTIMDLSVEAGALGLPVRFPISETATIEWHPVKTVRDLDQYKVIHPLSDGRVWVFLETVRLMKQKLDIPVGGYVIGPFTLAGLMIGATDVAMLTIDNPEVLHATVNFCEHVVIEYAKALQSAGADFIAILDPTAVILSPAAYDEFAGAPVENMVRHLDTKTVLHVCGNTTHLARNMCATGVQALSLDSAVSFPEVARLIPSDVVLIGNIDPVGTMLNGTTAEVQHDCEALLDSMAGFDNFILSTGCDLPAETPIENIAEMVRTAKSRKR